MLIFSKLYKKNKINLLNLVKLTRKSNIMKLLLILFLHLLPNFFNAQVDSVAFEINNVQISKVNLEQLTFNKSKVQTLSSDLSYIISIDNKCNLLPPKYTDLNQGEFNFYQIKGDVKTSLSVLGSRFSYDKKSEYYTLYFNRFAKIDCNSKELNYGVAFFVIIQISNIKSKVEINNIYDVSAMGQLGLANVTIDIKHFGLKPIAADAILPPNISKLDVESSKYFDGLLDKIKSILNDSNTITMQIPTTF